MISRGAAVTARSSSWELVNSIGWHFSRESDYFKRISSNNLQYFPTKTQKYKLFNTISIRTPVKRFVYLNANFKVKLALVDYVRTNLDIGGCHQNQNSQPILI
jgi:hypothetical protein